MGIDPVDAPIPVRPVVHYTMGGIDTNINGATRVGGLFAAGECACVSINGANRLGSNSLTELLVFGARAGRSAAGYAAAGGGAAVSEALVTEQAEAAENRVLALFRKTNGTEDIAVLRREMTATMEAGAGIYRSEDSLQEACAKMAEIRQRYASIELRDKSNVFNTDLTEALELKSMIDVAGALAVSAYQRTESRGSHQRLDYTERDDEKFLKHSLATYTAEGEPRIDYCDVVITRSKPGERVYGGKQE